MAQEAESVNDVIPHFDIFCDLHVLLNSCTATWNLLVLYNKETKKNVNDIIYASVLQYIIGKNQMNQHDS